VVLIVDDEKLLVRTLSNALREKGYEPAVAHTGEQAEKLLKSGKKFDLVLLDNRLPKMSGLDVLKSMRSESIGGKVILMTAYDSKEVKAEARRLKVDRYVTKPFDLTKMLGEIEGLMPPREDPDQQAS
jgi:DNA-binding response OmpR family regulator